MEKFSSLFNIKLIGPQIKLVIVYYYNKKKSYYPQNIYGYRCMNQIICSFPWLGWFLIRYKFRLVKETLLYMYDKKKKKKNSISTVIYDRICQYS